MSGTLNRVILVGNLGRDPEVRNLPSGQVVGHLALATSESWKTSDGQRKERTDWHPVVIYNDFFIDLAKRFLRKGSKCCIEGSLQHRKWQDTSGKDRYTTEVVIGVRQGRLTLMDPPPQSGRAESTDAINQEKYALSRRGSAEEISEAQF